MTERKWYINKSGVYFYRDWHSHIKRYRLGMEENIGDITNDDIIEGRRQLIQLYKITTQMGCLRVDLESITDDMLSKYADAIFDRIKYDRYANCIDSYRKAFSLVLLRKLIELYVEDECKYLIAVDQKVFGDVCKQNYIILYYIDCNFILNKRKILHSFSTITVPSINKRCNADRKLIISNVYNDKLLLKRDVGSVYCKYKKTYAEFNEIFSDVLITGKPLKNISPQDAYNKLESINTFDQLISSLKYIIGSDYQYFVYNYIIDKNIAVTVYIDMIDINKTVLNSIMVEIPMIGYGLDSSSLIEHINTNKSNLYKIAMNSIKDCKDFKSLNISLSLLKPANLVFTQSRVLIYTFKLKNIIAGE